MRQRFASEEGIEPYYIKGLEKHGLIFFLGHNSDAVGAQCKYCHSIVWVNARLDPILSETRPDNVSASGEDYRSYYKDNLNRFLNSIPACPECGKQEYDLFISNSDYPRFSDGTEFSGFDFENEDDETIPANATDVKIWWLDQ